MQLFASCRPQIVRFAVYNLQKVANPIDIPMKWTANGAKESNSCKKLQVSYYRCRIALG
jgi:hypothetical protein